MKYFNFTTPFETSNYDVCVSFVGKIPYKVKFYKRLTYYSLPFKGAHYFLHASFMHYMSFECANYLKKHSINVGIELNETINKKALSLGYIKV